MGFLGYSDVIRDGDKAIVYLGYNAMMPLKLSHGTVTQTRRGALRHSDIIGKKYGCRLSTLSGKGYVHLLQPTPELWTLNLPHRTQILYFADISLITLQLELKPGSVVVESGTGSGSVSHAFARTIAPSGHLHTFEFHEQRAQKAREDFEEHGISHLVTVAHRDVLEQGFGIDFTVDAVFLDLPCPWRALSHAKKILKRSGGKICSFSPCIEQVQRTCEELRSLGFSDISTLECLQRNFEHRTVTLPYPNLGKNTTGDGFKQTGPNVDDGCPPQDNVAVGTSMDGGQGERDTDAACRTSTPEAALPLNRQGETDQESDCNGGESRAKRPRLSEGATQDKKGASQSYPTKCAVPWKDMPGHTGFLTFATLYILPSGS
ncbi:tRNA (adenine(58)-N(1))-methyltransferase catalytic subunit TRMT61A-like [Acanthaster planci]|uniref:tRNA (adenine(58)-N(1))-methyltransferase catalytic subunit TRMT61A n=1 Tax=Acanthaster planci TaxID=133434 RepID=A0A8B7YPS8_ACAPL|nr:tRNA (adenine(58)-N(1))-methyltransferase catalytic subunit TRMT61A-like [Acanthaster planci]XP_022094682.1 tRNA (adenine(58)-N(1))-methyltransferase catalytic subunit TRMT61A-like [Acanthaster planci]